MDSEKGGGGDDQQTSRIENLFMMNMTNTPFPDQIPPTSFSLSGLFDMPTFAASPTPAVLASNYDYEKSGSSFGLSDLMGFQDYCFGSSLFDLIQTNNNNINTPAVATATPVHETTTSEVVNAPMTPNSSSISMSSNEAAAVVNEEESKEQDDEEKTVKQQ